MEISSSVYDYVMFDMNQEIKAIEHQMDTIGEAQNAKSGSDLNWRGYDNQSLGSSMSDFISMYENQQHLLTIGTDSMNQSLDWLVSDATKVNDMSMFLSDSETLWSFNGVLSASESKNRVTNSGQEIKSKSLKRNSDFKLNYNENPTKLKKPRSQKHQSTNFNRVLSSRPVDLEVEKRKRENVMISRDPQTVAARKRREKISERIRVLQRMIPGGTNMDTASVLEEAANYLRFLRAQVKVFENSCPNLTKP